MRLPKKIYLASTSPRRQELLRQIGVDFLVIPSGVAEDERAGESPADCARRLAVAKARAAHADLAAKRLEMRPIVGADTCVAVDGVILGKPRDRMDAKDMLRRLSNRSHRVHTGVCVIGQGSGGNPLEESFVCTSQVTFDALTDADIDDYWESGEPADKAGAYAIQGRAAVFVARLEGSYSNVMGLPLRELARILSKLETSQ